MAALVLLGLGVDGGEAFAPYFGMLGIGGLASFPLGAAILVDTDVLDFRIGGWVITALCVFSVVLIVPLSATGAVTSRKSWIGERDPAERGRWITSDSVAYQFASAEWRLQ